MKLLKARSSSGKRRHVSGSQDSSPDEAVGKKNIGQAASDTQETPVAEESCIKAVDDEREEGAQLPKSAGEEKDAPHHQGLAELPLELQHARKEQEEFDDPVPAHHGGIVGAMSPASQQDEEKVFLKGELESAKQANKELSLEVAESRRSLEATSDILRHLEAENTELEIRIQELEEECARLLAEREGRPSEGKLDRASQEKEELKELQETSKNLRESLSLLQREKDTSEIRCLQLEAALQGRTEETERRLAEQQQVSRYWQDRWEQEAAALKTKVEELEKANVQDQTWSPKLETPRLLQMELDACREDVALERHRVRPSQCGSPSSAVPTSESVLQEVDPEAALVREELQEARAMLKSRDTALEGQQLELESIRSQYAECSLEKQRLDLLVASLEEQLEEKGQALRRLEGAKDEAMTEREMKISFLEQKLAEMDAAQDLPGPGSKKTPTSQEVQKNAPCEDGRSQGTCSRCSAALAQLSRVIPSAGDREKAESTLVCLYQLQDLLKGSVLDRAPAPTPGQSPGQDPLARVVRSPQEEKEILNRRHRLVTEQLKELFRQREEQEQSQKHSLRRPWKSEEVLAMPESTRPRDDHRTATDIRKEVQRLQQQLKEKTEIIMSMASKIQDLQEKNDSLMKAKLRFQQQIQQIHNLPKQRPERSDAERLVPRISVGLGRDSQGAPGSDSPVPSPRSDEPPFAGGREDPGRSPRASRHPGGEEEQRRGSSSDEGTSPARFSALPRAQPSPPVSAGPSLKPLSLELVSSQQADNEVALLSPQGSALLSPRPFGPSRSWSPFKFKGHPELPEDREGH